MDNAALYHAVKMVALYGGISLGGGLVIWSAIWLPTWLLMSLGGWPFGDAYMMGAPFGLFGLCLIGIGAMSYRQKARQKGWQG
jgi:hypothetical protein